MPREFWPEPGFLAAWAMASVILVVGLFAITLKYPLVANRQWENLCARTNVAYGLRQASGDSRL